MDSTLEVKRDKYLWIFNGGGVKASREIPNGFLCI